MAIIDANRSAGADTLLLLRPAPARPSGNCRPFLGVTFGGRTTFFDLEHAADNPNLVIGFNSVLLGELIGIDADLGYAPGFFQSGDQHLVTRQQCHDADGQRRDRAAAAPDRVHPAARTSSPAPA